MSAVTSALMIGLIIGLIIGAATGLVVFSKIQDRADKSRKQYENSLFEMHNRAFILSLQYYNEIKGTNIDEKLILKFKKTLVNNTLTKVDIDMAMRNNPDYNHEDDIL